MKRLTVLFLFLFLCFSGVSAQEVSKRKEIALFKLGYTNWNMPNEVLGLVDQSIENVFVNLGRFDVIGMTYRLKSQDVLAFIRKIKQVKSSHIKVPEKVRLGEETFTEADFNKLVESFIIVVPIVTYFDVRRGDTGDYAAEMETSFTFISADEGRAIAAFSVKTAGTDETRKGAVRNAAEDISTQLSYEIRKIPAFQLKTGIIDVMGREVILELGHNMGVKRGDEFHIVSTRVLPSGYTVERNSGLLVVKEVDEEVSTAQVFYAKKKPAVGDQLKEIPRLGFETAFYTDYVNAYKPIVAMGFRQTVTRGFYSARPFVGAEIPLGVKDFVFFFPVNAYIGGEINWYLGRLHITPSADISFGMLVPIDKEYQDHVIYSSLGGHVRLSVSFMVSDSMKLFVEEGYTTMQSMSIFFDSYSGFFTGAGITLQY